MPFPMAMLNNQRVRLKLTPPTVTVTSYTFDFTLSATVQGKGRPKFRSGSNRSTSVPLRLFEETWSVFISISAEILGEFGISTKNHLKKKTCPFNY